MTVEDKAPLYVRFC